MNLTTTKRASSMLTAHLAQFVMAAPAFVESFPGPYYIVHVNYHDFMNITSVTTQSQSLSSHPFALLGPNSAESICYYIYKLKLPHMKPIYILIEILINGSDSVAPEIMQEHYISRVFRNAQPSP